VVLGGGVLCAIAMSSDLVDLVVDTMVFFLFVDEPRLSDDSRFTLVRFFLLIAIILCKVVLSSSILRVLGLPLFAGGFS
jgi:hypothetical protein